MHLPFVKPVEVVNDYAKSSVYRDAAACLASDSASLLLDFSMSAAHIAAPVAVVRRKKKDSTGMSSRIMATVPNQI